MQLQKKAGLEILDLGSRGIVISHLSDKNIPMWWPEIFLSQPVISSGSIYFEQFQEINQMFKYSGQLLVYL